MILGAFLCKQPLFILVPSLQQSPIFWPVPVDGAIQSMVVYDEDKSCDQVMPSPATSPDSFDDQKRRWL